MGSGPTRDREEPMHSEIRVGERNRRREAGFAIYVAAVAVVVVAGVVFTGVTILRSTQQSAEASFRSGGQAYHVARAGIIDAFSWFRRQTSQPVTDFDPKLDLTVDPPIRESDEPDVGIVRSFPITRDVWGRYEVRRTEVVDVSQQRGYGTSGGVWVIKSHGIVYRLRDPSKAWNEAPNHVLGRATLVTEIRRVTIAPPAQAAVCIARADALRVLSNGRIEGGDAIAGVTHPESTGSPTVSGELTGTPPRVAIDNYDWSVDTVFGVDLEQLKSMADDRVFENDEFPFPVPRNTFIFSETDLVFTKDRPLRGQGVIFVDGDLTIDSASNSFFTGFVYCTGHVNLRAPSLLRGALVCKSLEIVGTGDFAEMGYDEGALSALMSSIGQYRLSKAIHSPDDWE
jgi:hypothetical protein